MNNIILNIVVLHIFTDVAVSNLAPILHYFEIKERKSIAYLLALGGYNRISYDWTREI